MKVSHVGLSDIERFIRNYAIADPISAFKGRPVVPEYDFSGIVSDLIGSDVTDLKPGV